MLARFTGVFARLDPLPLLLARVLLLSPRKTAAGPVVAVAVAVAFVVVDAAGRRGAMGPSPHAISASNSLPQSDTESASESLADTSACGSSRRLVVSAIVRADAAGVVVVEIRSADVSL